MLLLFVRAVAVSLAASFSSSVPRELLLPGDDGFHYSMALSCPLLRPWVDLEGASIAMGYPVDGQALFLKAVKPLEQLEAMIAAKEGMNTVIFQITVAGVRVLTTNPFDGKTSERIKVQRQGKIAWRLGARLMDKENLLSVVYNAEHVRVILNAIRLLPGHRLIFTNLLQMDVSSYPWIGESSREMTSGNPVAALLVASRAAFVPSAIEQKYTLIDLTLTMHAEGITVTSRQYRHFPVHVSQSLSVKTLNNPDYREDGKQSHFEVHYESNGQAFAATSLEPNGFTEVLRLIHSDFNLDRITVKGVSTVAKERLGRQGYEISDVSSYELFIGMAKNLIVDLETADPRILWVSFSMDKIVPVLEVYFLREDSDAIRTKLE